MTSKEEEERKFTRLLEEASSLKDNKDGDAMLIAIISTLCFLAGFCVAMFAASIYKGSTLNIVPGESVTCQGSLRIERDRVSCQ
jgi:hypothetical protein